MAKQKTYKTQDAKAEQPVKVTASPASVGNAYRPSHRTGAHQQGAKRLRTRGARNRQAIADY